MLAEQLEQLENKREEVNEEKEVKLLWYCFIFIDCSLFLKDFLYSTDEIIQYILFSYVWMKYKPNENDWLKETCALNFKWPS